MVTFVQVGGPAFVVAFVLGLFIRRRFLAVLGVAMLAVVLLWLAFEEVDPLAHEGDLRRLVALLWFVGWLLGLAFAGLTRGVGWLYGVGTDDE